MSPWFDTALSRQPVSANQRVSANRRASAPDCNPMSEMEAAAGGSRDSRAAVGGRRSSAAAGRRASMQPQHERASSVSSDQMVQVLAFTCHARALTPTLTLTLALPPNPQT